ncbi:MAG: rhodanese-like domain-containing protein [Ignavibacteria bacterium]|nr:rhodanese-like domain-containing protein [Ignavibacteria bacterium]
MKKTFHEYCDDLKINIRECSVNDVSNMLKENEDFYLVDIREDNEFNSGRIKGSIHIGKGIIERDIHLYIPDHDKKIVLYCGGGFRTIIAADSLKKMGYSNVFSMEGGWKKWLKENGETEC